MLNPNFPWPKERKEVMEQCTPEMAALYEATQVGARHLHDAGYSKTAEGKEEEEVGDDASGLDIEQQLAVWSTTLNYKKAEGQKAWLVVHGEGEPTGRGEGFSFLRTNMKSYFLRKGETEAGRRCKCSVFCLVFLFLPPLLCPSLSLCSFGDSRSVADADSQWKQKQKPTANQSKFQMPNNNRYTKRRSGKYGIYNGVRSPTPPLRRLRQRTKRHRLRQRLSGASIRVSVAGTLVRGPEEGHWLLRRRMKVRAEGTLRLRRSRWMGRARILVRRTRRRYCGSGGL